MSIGIIGLGTYLPADVRTNAWWPEHVVEGWHERMANRATRADASHVEEMTPAMQRTLAALQEYADDPFRGARERHVMADDMTVSEMEANAAREALDNAGIGPGDVDVILSQTPVPDQLMVNSACVTHRLLNLPRRCIALGTEGACNGMALHLSIAKGLIESGQARNVLSVHSSAITRVHGPAEPHSAWWGDGAAAAVISRVGDGRGIVSAVHNADGSTCNSLVLGVPGRRWWELGEITTHSLDREHTRLMIRTLIDRAGETIKEALAKASVAPEDVDFYAAHQGTAWFANATAAHAGLVRAKTLNTFPMLANMNSVNIPFILAMGVREGAVRDGSIILTFSGGLGETWSGIVMRWGR
jgi:3-oxoacyl-[acyl-carrier-protein] synthase III